MKSVSSQKLIPNDNFKVKLGTFNKKQPQTIYVELESYITPTEIKENYDNDIFSLDRALKHEVSKFCKNSDDFYKDNFVITDVPTARLSVHKKTHFSLQIHLKPIINEDTNFTSMIKTYTEKYTTTINNIKSILNNNGFTTSKTKS